MHSRLGLALCFVLLLGIIITPALAAQTDDKNPPRIGLGITFIDTPAPLVSQYRFVPARPARILLPIRLTSRVVIEPEIRFIDRSWWESSYRINARWLGIGVGFLRLTGSVESVRLYYGARLAMSRIDYYGKVQTGSAIPDLQAAFRSLSAALCVGGEYYLSPHFSVGGEAQVQLTTLRGRDGYHPFSDDEKSARSGSTTTGILCFIRVYP